MVSNIKNKTQLFSIIYFPSPPPRILRRNTMNRADIEAKLNSAKNRKWMNEIGNDMYYSSPQYDEDQAEIQHWEEKLKEFDKENSNA